MRRILRIDVCDYENNILCNLYDNKCMVSGCAVDVFISTERNGWKELSFTIPTKCVTDEGEEENFRLNYIKAAYLLRAIDDFEEDYYIISEPKITHAENSRDIEVTADHVSQLLKNRSLDLEFSDEEGNNVGTAASFLDTILEGSGWSPGYVFPFKEKNGKPKVRTLVASPRTGAANLISSLCELFDAVPIYHGGTKTVDLVPINPFVFVKDGNYIQDIIDNNRNVVELHYGHSIKTLDQTVNIENLVTRFYAYGSSGEAYGIDIKQCTHKEYTFTIKDEVKNKYEFKDSENVYYYFSPVNAQVGDTLTWSMLDLTSRTYIRNNRTNDIYRVYKTPKGEYTTLSAEPEDVVNWFPYITCFDYYDEIGLLSDNQLKELADFQKDMPILYEQAYNASLALAQKEMELSETANPGDGFCRLIVTDIQDETIQVGGSTITFSKFTLGNSQEYPDAVLFRSDYNSRESDYFQWHVAKQLKENGDPTSGIGSLIYIIHADGKWDTMYVRYIFDSSGNMYIKENGDPKDYVYSAESDYPSAIGVHATGVQLNEGDHIYLFCTNSMTGSLGRAQVQDESVIQNLQDKTTVVTEKHPVIFQRITEVMSSPPGSVLSGYGWLYRYTSDASNGELYFCWGKREDSMWHRVYYGKTEPVVQSNEVYFFNTKKKTLHRRKNGAWYKYETFEEQELAKTFSIVIYNCRKRDMLYKGLYDEYTYAADELTPGNYAFESDYEFYWLFTTDQEVSGPLKLDTSNDHIYQDTDVGHIVSASVYSYDTVDYPVENELASVNLTKGSIDPATGVEILSETNYVTSAVTLFEGESYDYLLPSNSRVLFYDANMMYLGKTEIGGEGKFTPIVSETSLSDIAVKFSRYARFVFPNTILAPSQERQEKLAALSVLQSALATYNEELENLTEGSTAWSDKRAQIFSTKDRIDELNNEILSIPLEINSSYYVHVENYDNKLYANQTMYTILSPTVSSGEQKGINYLTNHFDELATETYITYLTALNSAQQALTDRDNQLKEDLGDLIREGWWQDNSYTEGDEDRLYNDAMDNLREVSKPEITYSFTYIDLFEAEPQLDDLVDVPWPDIQITDIAHLTDPDMTVNVWGYIDRINKCFDKPWETTIEINTRLSTIGQHEFSDVLTRIANVAKEMKANQPIYAKASSLNSNGTIPSANLEGTIALHKTALLSDASNWYTDENGNMVFESADGQSAMLLGGRGFGLARSKDKDGDWEWRAFGDGQGFTADEITVGTLSADRIGAKSITVDKLTSNVGHDLDISTNKTLSLYATVDGTKPSGALKTTDSVIQISGGDAYSKAMINVKTGGELNLVGGDINIESNGKLSLASSGEFYLRANGADYIDSTADGIYIGSDGFNFGGGKFKMVTSGSGSSLTATSNSIFFGDLYYTKEEGGQQVQCFYPIEGITTGACLRIDAINGTMSLYANNTIDITSGKSLTLLSGGNIKIGNIANPFTIGAESSTPRAYIYSGLDRLTGTSDGVYLGTDGIYIRGTSSGVTNYIKATKSGNIDVSGTIHSKDGDIGGWIISDSKLYSYTLKNDSQGRAPGSTGYVTTYNTYLGFSSSGTYALWAGAASASESKFYVKHNGAVSAQDITITGGSITLASNGTTYFQASKSGVTINQGTIQMRDGNGNVIFGVTTNGELTANKGTIGSWNLGTNFTVNGATRTDLLWSGNSGKYVVLDGSTDVVYPLSGLSTNVSDSYKVLYAMWAGNANPQSAPFSVTKDGIVTITKLRIRKEDNTYDEVNLRSWLSTNDESQEDDPDPYKKDYTMGKLKYQTVRNIDVNKTTGKVTINITNNSGGYSSKTFNSADSVQLSATWAGQASYGYGTGSAEVKAYYNDGEKDVTVSTVKYSFSEHTSGEFVVVKLSTSEDDNRLDVPHIRLLNWQAGWEKAATRVHFPTTNTSTNNFYFTAPSATAPDDMTKTGTDRGGSGHPYYIYEEYTNENTYRVYVKGGPSTITIAELKPSVIYGKAYNNGLDSASPFCSHDNAGTEMATTVNIDAGTTYSVWAGITKSDNSKKWSKEYKIHARVPGVSNVDRKSSDITGTNAGDVSAKTGSYVTFEIAGNKYYIKIS